ncbi:MAG: dihydrolipoyllysine-residue succinyltransferase, partial [Woeseiaceae bacterium]|nr:dihydrolipoyllysine-residue succinyltransferase [Woeseiaceae bacterium]
MDVLMPQLGETVLEGTVAAWYKAAGDSVAKGDLLLDVETDKAATEIEAPEAGVLSSINVPEGETVDVGTVLAVIAVEGESAAEVPAESAPPVGAASAATPAGGGLPPKSTGSGKLSPAVRRLLKQHDLSVDAISGTGRDGRVTRQDVLDFVAAKAAPTSSAAAVGAASAATASSAAAVGAASAATPQDVERIPFDRFRKVTAEHMVRSKATSPHVLQAIDADFTAVDAVRLGRKDAWKADKGYSLTYLPFVARAVCQALAE